MRNPFRALVANSRDESRDIISLEDYVSALNSFVYNGFSYGLGSSVQQTLVTGQSEPIPNDFRAFSQLYRSNGIIFAVMAVRMSVFSSIRFKWQKDNIDGMPSKLFGNGDLEILEVPWAGGTTQDLLVRMIQDADLCGNSYWTIVEGEFVRLNPAWMQIIVSQVTLPGTKDVVGWKKEGYAYFHNGMANNDSPTFLTVKEVAHFAPTPDPDATFRGMSWISSILPEARGDRTMQTHQQKFLDNGATPNMVVSMDKSVSWESFQKFKALMEKDHSGTRNAYKTMYLGAGADVKVVGADMKTLNLKELQGHGETRIAAAGGVPPVIVGLSEGLEAATYSNYGQARRRLADGTMHPLWQNAAGTLGILFNNPAPRSATRMWYDSRGVPFLREDEKDAAEIQGKRAETISKLISAGYKPDSVTLAVGAEDFTLLEHTGLYSVQLQPPGTTTPPAVPAAPPPSILPDQKLLPSATQKKSRYQELDEVDDNQSTKLYVAGSDD